MANRKEMDAAWQLASRHLPDAKTLRQTWRDAKAAEARPVQVAACGVVNAGKSTLLNALAHATEGDIFAVGPVRETNEIKRFACDGYELMDTPGLDALEKDDPKAWVGIAASDLVLMVHNSSNGELGSEQLKLLDDLAQRGCAGRVVLVLTHLAEMRDQIEKLSTVIGQQVRERLARAVPIFSVASTSYLRGLRENKPALMANSGVMALRFHVEAQVTARQREFIAERAARVTAARRAVLAGIERAIAERQAKISQIDQMEAIRHRKFAQELRRLWSQLLEMIDGYDKLKQRAP